MHRVIMDAPAGIQVDHINHNGLDNRKENLRFCNNRQNHQNGLIKKTSKAPYKGISDHDGTWEATITVNGKRLWLGAFGTPELAACAYDNAAQKHFGQFACTNFPHAVEIPEDHGLVALNISRLQQGRKRRERGSSSYVGVFKQGGGWVAKIRLNGVTQYLGYHKREDDAARAYNRAAQETFGESARLNQIGP
jgi:hypothetical protein